MEINIRKTKKIVKEYLEKYAHLRDDDERLIASIWHIELLHRGVNSKNITGFQFLDSFAKGELTNPESIRRSRAKLQEENVHLRGLKYNERKANTGNIKSQLR
jgi:hypothetical protein